VADVGVFPGRVGERDVSIIQTLRPSLPQQWDLESWWQSWASSTVTLAAWADKLHVFALLWGCWLSLCCERVQEVKGEVLDSPHCGGRGGAVSQQCEKDHNMEQLVARCSVIAELATKVGWSRIWNATLDLGGKRISGFQYLSRVMSHHGRWKHPCLLCDAAPLQTSTYYVDHHSTDLHLEQGLRSESLIDLLEGINWSWWTPQEVWHSQTVS